MSRRNKLRVVSLKPRRQLTLEELVSEAYSDGLSSMDHVAVDRLAEESKMVSHIIQRAVTCDWVPSRDRQLAAGMDAAINYQVRKCPICRSVYRARFVFDLQLAAKKLGLGITAMRKAFSGLAQVDRHNGRSLVCCVRCASTVLGLLETRAAVEAIGPDGSDFVERKTETLQLLRSKLDHTPAPDGLYDEPSPLETVGALRVFFQKLIG